MTRRDLAGPRSTGTAAAWKPQLLLPLAVPAHGISVSGWGKEAGFCFPSALLSWGSSLSPARAGIPWSDAELGDGKQDPAAPAHQPGTEKAEASYASKKQPPQLPRNISQSRARQFWGWRHSASDPERHAAAAAIALPQGSQPPVPSSAPVLPARPPPGPPPPTTGG